MGSLLNRFRPLLVLGRISNLPTVWSNCLAAWVLAGGRAWAQLAVACLGGTLLYTGGMFLNDAFDVEFDRRFRPERPIVSGQVSLTVVWAAGTALLVLGEICFCRLGKSACAFGLGLGATILLYDAVHKKTNLAPLLMAGCRFLLYMAAASAAAPAAMPKVWLHAGVLGAYIVGLSYIARRESTSAHPVTWPVPLVFLPVFISVADGPLPDWFGWARALGAGLWVSWSVYSLGRVVPGALPRGVAGLLAGIALLDWLAASAHSPIAGLICVGLFLLALLLQRV
ncbi:MAG TPA: UbiA family prenyltransferase, partial [Verrucomicrobiae bacterium]|nr:UbiA family prenyltransferase [Verrucomicrobiae bacterium]